jgi:hypothetical protein
VYVWMVGAVMVPGVDCRKRKVVERGFSRGKRLARAGRPPRLCP